MEYYQRNSQIETEEAITSATRSIQYQKMDKDRNRDNCKADCKIIRESKQFKTIILRSFKPFKHNGPSESISCKTERMKQNDDTEQDSNSRYKLVVFITQIEHSIVIDIDTTINDNDNGCSNNRMMFSASDGIGNDSNGSWNEEQKISEISKQYQGSQCYKLRPRKFFKDIKELVSSIPSDQKRQQHSGFRSQEKESYINIDK
ncbi:MAG: hypothetical protein EZS28_025796 [Streblomastix strix]|uniref:Uncharacterized protein n=1 Tax=Streblomastix strix TaxID=222440 RepID=A0A5J4V7P5_9EUKA|nr:MAG: hypothetical protein EZS28_025796 [Streblomastix strix]